MDCLGADESGASMKLKDTTRGRVIEDYKHCLEIWSSAGTDQILLPVMSRAEAMSLRHRLYRIRAAMKAQRHPYYERAAGATISLIQVDTGVGGEELWAICIKPMRPSAL
jgi:hypothetical protein